MRRRLALAADNLAACVMLGPGCVTFRLPGLGPAHPKIAIIGAGSSGIAAARALHQRDLPFDCFEASDRVGANWVYGNANGMSSAYRSLHIKHLARADAVRRLPDAGLLSRLSPFFDEDFIAAPGNRIEQLPPRLPPRDPRRLLRGAGPARGAIMPLAEAQGQLIAAHLRGGHQEALAA